MLFNIKLVLPAEDSSFGAVAAPEIFSGGGLSPFPPLPFPYLPLSLSPPLPSLPSSPSLPSLPLPLEVGPPLLGLGGLGERFSSPSGSGRSPAAKRILVHFELKSVVPIFRTFLRINWPNLVKFKQQRAWHVLFKIRHLVRAIFTLVRKKYRATSTHTVHLVVPIVKIHGYLLGLYRNSAPLAKNYNILFSISYSDEPKIALISILFTSGVCGWLDVSLNERFRASLFHFTASPDSGVG